MTDQEKKYADEFLFQYFNSDETGAWSIAVQAATMAGYILPESKLKVELLVKAIHTKLEVQTYIKDKISELKEKLHPSQRRVLWKAITETVTGEPDEWEQEGFIKYRL